jgi:hypothetical protein
MCCCIVPLCVHVTGLSGRCFLLVRKISLQTRNTMKVPLAPGRRTRREDQAMTHRPARPPRRELLSMMTSFGNAYSST